MALDPTEWKPQAPTMGPRGLEGRSRFVPYHPPDTSYDRNKKVGGKQGVRKRGVLAPAGELDGKVSPIDEAMSLVINPPVTGGQIPWVDPHRQAVAAIVRDTGDRYQPYEQFGDTAQPLDSAQQRLRRNASIRQIMGDR